MASLNLIDFLEGRIVILRVISPTSVMARKGAIGSFLRARLRP